MKFEFMVTVHYIAYGQNAPSCGPLNLIKLLNFLHIHFLGTIIPKMVIGTIKWNWSANEQIILSSCKGKLTQGQPLKRVKSYIMNQNLCWNNQLLSVLYILK